MLVVRVTDVHEQHLVVILCCAVVDERPTEARTDVITLRIVFLRSSITELLQMLPLSETIQHFIKTI